MLYTEMNINQKINFKSWRLSIEQKLRRRDYFPKEGDFEFWSEQGVLCTEPCFGY